MALTVAHMVNDESSVKTNRVLHLSELYLIRKRLIRRDDQRIRSNGPQNEKPPNDRGFNDKCELLTITDNQRQAERAGFEPAVGLKPYTDLANRRIRPLCHLSDPRADGEI